MMETSTTATEYGQVKWCAVGIRFDLFCDNFSEDAITSLIEIKHPKKYRFFKHFDTETIRYFKGPDIRICTKHFDLFTKCPQNYCQNLKAHKKACKTHLISITIEDYCKYFSCENKLFPNASICTNCYSRICKTKTVKEVNVLENAPSEDPIFSTPQRKKNLIGKVNKHLIESELSPIECQKWNKKRQATAVRRKIDKLKDKLESDFKECGLSIENNSARNEFSQLKRDSKDLNILMMELKERLKSATQSQKRSFLTLIPQSWSCHKASRFFGISRKSVAKAKLDKKARFILPPLVRKIGNPLSTEVVEKIKTFYYEDGISRATPGLHDCKSVKLTDGKRKLIQKRLLLLNLNEAYAQFIEKYPNDNVKRSSFHALRPKECVLQSQTGYHNVCCCIYHENINHLFDAIKRHNYDEFRQKLICDADSKDCMYRLCAVCKTQQQACKNAIQSCMDPDITSVNFNRWVVNNSKGAQFIKRSLSREDFVNFATLELENFLKHSYISRKQRVFQNSLKESLSPGEILVMIDFSENYDPKIQNEVQSAYYRHDWKQIALHPFIAYYRREDKLQHVSFCAVSDELKHDTNIVHAFQYQFIKRIQSYFESINMPKITKIFYFSDGAGSQYKSYKMFVNIFYHKLDFQVEAEYHYSASYHGKSPCDAIGGTSKREIRNFSLQNPTNPVITVSQFVEVANKRLPNVSFFNVSADNVRSHIVAFKLEERYSTFKTVPGTRSFHKVVPFYKGYNIGGLKFFETSSDMNMTTYSTIGNDMNFLFDDSVLKDGDFIVCIYERQWHVSQILEIDRQIEACFVDLYKCKTRTRTSNFVKKGIQNWISFGTIIDSLLPPKQKTTDWIILLSVQFRKWDLRLMEHLNIDK